VDWFVRYHGSIFLHGTEPTMEQQIYDWLLQGVFAAALAFFLILMFVSAPYGKQEREGWGPGVNMRFGWFILELPSFACMLWFYWQGEHRLAAAPLLLFTLFEIHYFHRTFIYPLQLRVKPGARYRVILLLFGMAFNSANGALNGWFLSELGTHLHDNRWLSDPRFIIGIMLFAGGFALAKQSDAILRNLRQPGESGYKIPYGGGYRFVSCPNYLGEILQWTGFAIAGWSLPALAFACFTAANLVPKALSSHRWYREHFGDYPPGRKAIIPFLL
jgi:3-oxo-5-alpha-steroid 4-dehydrogenase 1